MKTTQQREAGVPKYVELAREFRRQIKSGALKPGDKLPSFIEMREQFGIGQGTLERVHALLAQDGLISREPGRGTFIRRQEAPPTTGIIGFCGYGFTLTSTSYWAQIITGVREVLGREDAQVLLLDGDSPSGWDKVDGILMSEWDPGVALRWIPENRPCVSLVVPVPQIPNVLVDDEGGGRAATQHLIDLGHRRIANLGGAHFSDRRPNPVNAQRFNGYREALHEAHVKADPAWVRRLPMPSSYAEKLVDLGRETMARWLREGWRDLGCTAIVAHNDEVAFGVVEALQGCGISVPHEVSVIGFDGVDLCEYSKPRLSSVKIPLRQVGAAAAELLIRQIREPETLAETIVIPVQVEQRESTAAEPCNN